MDDKNAKSSGDPQDEPIEPGWEDLFGDAQPSEIPFATEATFHQARKAERVDPGQRQLLSFSVGGEGYAVDLDQVKEILKFRPVTPVPRTKPFVTGVISVRGVVMPVVDLGLRLGMGPTAVTAQTRILVTGDDEQRYGLMVESVAGVERTGAFRVEPPPGVMSPAEAELVEGIGRVGTNMYILLRIDAILDFEAVA
jgi:purine-binding chemotaxis protein CheW